jgi:hypothetical protein
MSLLHASGADICGYLASALVLATFSMTSMRALRLTAIASNLAFITYALMAGARPILVLHSVMLPLNVWRLSQLRPRQSSGQILERESMEGKPVIGLLR